MLTSGGALALVVTGVGLLVVLVAFGRLMFAPAATTGLLVVVVVSDISSVIGKSGSLSIYLLVLALAAVTLALAVRRGALRPRWSPFFLLAAVWLGTRALSVLNARNISVGASELLDEAKGLVLLVVLTILLSGVKRPERIIGLAVVTVAALAGVTLVQEFVLHDSSNLSGLSGIGVASEVAGLGARHSGPESDPNFWGRILVLFVPLALVLAWRPARRAQPGRSWWRSPWWWLIAGVALLGGVYLSQSRGGMIAALLTTAVALALIVRNRMRLMAGAAAMAVVVLLIPGVANRLGTLASLDRPPATGVVDQSLLGREAALHAGLAMFRDSPLIGVGAGNFQSAGVTYQRELGLAALSLKGGRLLAPHDLYLQMVAEGGLIGLFGWLVFYIGSLLLVWRTRRRWRLLNGGSDGVHSRLASGVFASLIGWGLASVFLHLANLPVLMVIISFGAVLHLRARDMPDPEPPDEATLEARRRAALTGKSTVAARASAVQTSLVLLAVLLFGSSLFAGRMASTTRVGWSATAVVGMVPTQTAGWTLGYSYSVLSRTKSLPTFVELASSPRFLTAAADSLQLSSADRRNVYLTADRQPNAETFRITATAASVSLARPLLDAAVTSFHDYLTSAGSLYDVHVLTRPPVVHVGGSRGRDRALAVLADVLGAVTVLLVLFNHSRRRRKSTERRPRKSGGGAHRFQRRSPPRPKETAGNLSLRSQALRGFLWSAISFGGNKLFVFASTLVLTRLLAPANFGVVAAGLTVMAYLEVVLDLGMSSAVVHQQERGHGRSVHAAFSVNFSVCVVLAALNLLAAPSLASFFRVPHATAVFRALSIYIVLRGFGAVQDALLNRDLRFKEKAAADLTRALVRGSLGIALVLIGWDVWALVVAFLVAEGAGTAVAWSRTRYRPVLAYDWATVKPLMRFGASVAALQLLSELAINSDYLVVGHQLGSVALGLYTVAFRLPELLLSNVYWIFSSVAFPVLSRARTEGPDAFRRAMLGATRLVTMYGFPISVALALVSRDAVHVLFGTKWDGAGTPMTLVSLALGLASVGYASGDVFKAAGRPGTLLWINTILTAVMLVGFIIAAPYGIAAVASVHLCSQFVYAFVRLGIANRFMGTTATQVARAMGPSLAVSAGIALFALPPRLLLSQGAVALVAIVIAGTLGAALGIAVAGRSAVAEIRQMIREGRAKAGPRTGVVTPASNFEDFELQTAWSAPTTA